jgi:hypothetical protein
MRGSDFHQIAADDDRPGEIPAHRGDRGRETGRFFVESRRLE